MKQNGADTNRIENRQLFSEGSSIAAHNKSSTFLSAKSFAGLLYKGQLIPELIFDILNFSKKTELF